jgi:signal transduction histidine kinase
VFEPFYTTKLGQGGSGLGMFIVHNLTHGGLKGDIHLDSEPGKGVCFTLSLPLVVPARALEPEM